MSNPIALPEIFQAAFEDFIIPSYETAPISTIQNRAKVVRSLKAIAGVERIMCKGVNILPNEFGPNGEIVWESSDKDPRVRFVGVGWINTSNSQGSRPVTVSLNDYVEMVFYGTGLNIMINVASTIDIRATVDGGTEGANIIPASLSNILDGRNYGNNTVFPIAAGLTLGWHHVKIREANTIGLPFYGFEILNERTNLAVYSGTGVSNGSSQGLSALATSAFKAGVSGTRGARVVKYVQGGVVSQAVQEVDATSKYLALADHTNEEVIRRINFREFGAGRADDFSTLSTSRSAAFTLDDGTTTLVGNTVSAGVNGGVDSIGFPTAGTTSVTLTFVGTGVDILAMSTVVFTGSFAITIDGVSIGTITSSQVGSRIVKIASGLPYGTHTLKILYSTSSAGDWMLSDFVTYRPKTPSIPVGALKVAAYNVMADFITNASVGSDFIGTGVLRKANIREITYVGTWTTAISVPEIGGWNVNSTTVGNYIQYSFFGTGFDFRFSSGVGTSNHQITIDGSTNLSTFSTSFYGAGVTAFTTSTGTYTTTTGIGNGVRVSGLALGLHTVKITRTSGVTSVSPQAFDIITPIHAQEPSFKVGSNSLKSVTKYSPEKSVANAGPDLSKAKAWVNYSAGNLAIRSSYNVSAVLKVAAGGFNVYFEKPFKNYNYTVFVCGQNTGQFEYEFLYQNVVQIYTSNSAGTYVDSDFCVVIFGEQADE